MTELHLEATYLDLRKIGPWLSSILNDYDEGLLGSIELGVHELATNSVDHAHSPDESLTLRAAIEGELLVVELIDRGVAFEAETVVSPNPDEPQVRGYGLMILEQLASELTYARHDEQNNWRATFPLEPTH